MTDGYADMLCCPSCGEMCQTMLPNRPTPQYRYPWWEEGQYATCQCGADLLVDADGERAWLVERNAKPARGVAGDHCGPGNECGRLGCPECQQ